MDDTQEEKGRIFKLVVSENYQRKRVGGFGTEEVEGMSWLL